MTKPQLRRAVIYVRISKDREGSHLGTARQEAECRALANRLGLVVVAVYEDDDVSAYSGKVRKGYRRMLDDLQAGRATVVLAWHTDRLHRSPKELEEYIDVSEAHGVTTQTVQAGELDLSTPAGRAVARTLGAWARYESEHKSARVKLKKDELARGGKYSGGPRPFGYERQEDGTLVVVPAEAEAIREAYSVILHGGSLRAATHELNERGVRTTLSNGRWVPKTAKQTLLRASLAGLCQHRGEVVGGGVWPAIVSPEEFYAVQMILTDPRRDMTGTTGPEPRWLGSMIYKCGVCGGPLRVSSHGGRRGSYQSYRCKVAQDEPGGGGAHVARSRQSLDAYIEDQLLRRLETPKGAAKFAPKPQPLVDVVALRNRITALKEKEKGMGVKYGRDEIDEETLDSFNRENRPKIAELEAQLAASSIVSAAGDLVSKGDVRATWAMYKDDLDQRRAILREVVTVTVLPMANGLRGGRFNPEFIKLDWR